MIKKYIIIFTVICVGLISYFGIKYLIDLNDFKKVGLMQERLSAFQKSYNPNCSNKLMIQQYNSMLQHLQNRRDKLPNKLKQEIKTDGLKPIHCN